MTKIKEGVKHIFGGDKDKNQTDLEK